MSDIFQTQKYREIEDRIKLFLNQQEDFLTAHTVDSPRAVGDAVQALLSQQFATILGPDICAKYSPAFARRAMADLAFEDAAGRYYVVDVKSHRLGAKFSMPNLTSVERLARFCEEDRNYFVLLLFDYDVRGVQLVVENVHFVPIEFLSWDCLTIGALGWGQIQIANANRVIIRSDHARRAWMIELCDALIEFYPREIAKIDERLKYFTAVRQRWLSRDTL